MLVTRETLDLQIRDGDDGSATIEGRAVPYGQTIDLGGITETFAPGSVADFTGAPVLWQHDRAEVVGVVQEFRQEDDGPHFTARLIPTSRGRDAITALRARAVTGLSIGFEPGDEDWQGSHVTRRSATVREVSIATIPAYQDAEVLAVRNQQEGSTVDTTTPEVPQVDLTTLATREDLTALESRIQSAITPPTPPATLAVRDALVLQLTASRDGRKLRALDDVLSSGNAGVLPAAWSSEVRGYVDAMRYTFAVCGGIGFPSAGYTLTVPKVTQHTTVAARGTEKTQIPSQALETGSDTFTAKWFAGGVDIALELIWQSDPSVYGLVVDDILAQYAVATDTALYADVLAVAAASGAALDLTDYGSFIGDALATAETIRAATGVWGDQLMVTTATWQAILGLLDGDGRRALAPVGATNADGTAPILSRSVNIGGVNVVHNPRATVDIQTNTRSARVAERPPAMLTSDNVALMGRDLGVLGAYMFVPAYPAGIVKYAAA